MGIKERDRMIGSASQRCRQIAYCSKLSLETPSQELFIQP